MQHRAQMILNESLSKVVWIWRSTAKITNLTILMKISKNANVQVKFPYKSKVHNSKFHFKTLFLGSVDVVIKSTP